MQYRWEKYGYEGLQSATFDFICLLQVQWSVFSIDAIT